MLKGQLHSAARDNRVDEVKDLVNNYNADVNEMGNGYTPLNEAIHANNIEVARFLLSRDDCKVNLLQDQLMTPLHTAVAMSPEMVSELLSHPDVKFNERDRDGNTPFMIGCQYGNVDTLKILLGDEYKDKLQTDCVNNELITASKIACKFGQVRVVELLVNRNIFQATITNNNKMEPILEAGAQGYNNVVRYLIENHDLAYKCNTTAEQERQQPEKHSSLEETIDKCLEVCCMQGHIEIVTFLLSKIKPGDAMVENLLNSLQLAIRHNRVKLVKMISDKLLDMKTPLDYEKIRDIFDNSFWSPHAGITRALYRLWDTTYRLQFVDDKMTKLNILKNIFNQPDTQKLAPRANVLNKMLYHAVKYKLYDVINLILDTASEEKLVQYANDSIQGLTLHQLALKNTVLSEIVDNKIPNRDESKATDDQAMITWYQFYDSLSSSIDFNPSAPTGLTCTDIPEAITNVLANDDTLRKSSAAYDEVKERIDADPEQTRLVTESILKFMNTVAAFVKSKLPILQFTLEQVGSSAEGTRPFLPDEFDFLLVCTQMKKCLSLENSYLSSFINVHISPGTQSIIPSHLINVGKDLDPADVNVNTIKEIMDKTFKFAMDRCYPDGKIGDHLYYDPGFYETKKVSTLHLMWRGPKYRDMPITIDLVPAFELEDYQYEPKCRYIKDDCKYWVFCKGFEDELANTMTYPVAYSNVERKFIQSMTSEAQAGFKLAKGLRRSAVFPAAVKEMLHYVGSIEDCLTTYMLKTSLIMVYSMLLTEKKVPESGPAFKPEEWAYLIYKHIEIRLLNHGLLPSLFEIHKQKHALLLLDCSDSIDIAATEQRACCVKRKNLTVIASLMSQLLEKRLLKNLNKMDMSKLTENAENIARITITKLQKDLRDNGIIKSDYERALDNNPFEGIFGF